MANERGHRVSVVGRQRQAVERLKASLFGTDPYVRRRYILDFHREFRSYRSVVSLDQIKEASSRADVVFVGDYHAQPSCQAFATDLLQRLAGEPRPLILFIEMVFARHQRALEEYLDEEINDEELRLRIHYDRDWGYPWEGYGRLLSAARECGVEVVAADAPPRSGLRLIRRRDRHAATKIRESLQREPNARALVLFGESHMAGGHLPRELDDELRLFGEQRSSIVVVQNVEEIYWSLARAGREGSEAVMIDSRRYCVFNASPLAKYESYRQTLLRWSQQEDEAPDFGPSLHHLIDLLVTYIGLDRYRTSVPAPGGAVAPLVDLYPDVVTRRDRRRRYDPRPRRRKRRPGLVYRAGANRIDVYAFSLAAAGEAAARFLLAALRGRAGRSDAIPARAGQPSPGEGGPRGPRGRKDLSGTVKALPYAMTILDEAFVAFAVHYLDPGSPPSGRVPGGRARGSHRHRGRPRQARESFAELIDAASGPRADRRSAARRRASAEKTARLGEALGEAIYARLSRGLDGRPAQRWLREVVRFAGDRSGDGTARAERLLQEAATHTGWSR